MAARRNETKERPWEVHGVVQRGDKNYWTRIGAAFHNKDGSINLLLDYVPTDSETTIQLRPPKED